VEDKGFKDDVMKIRIDHSIRRALLYLKHHSLLAELFSMSGGPYWCERQQRQGDYDCIQRKGGGAMRGSKQRINSKSASPESFSQQQGKMKGKAAKIWLKLKQRWRATL